MSDYRNMDWYDGPDAEPVEAHEPEPPREKRGGRGAWLAAAGVSIMAVAGFAAWAGQHGDGGGHATPAAATSTNAATEGDSHGAPVSSAASPSTSWPVVTSPTSVPSNTTSVEGKSNEPKDEQQKKRDSDAKAEAVAVMKLFARPDMPKDEWFNALKPHLDGNFAESTRYTDPASVSAHKVTGEAVVRPMYASDAREVAVPTDSGVWTVGMTYDTTVSKWVVSSISMPGDNGPGDH